MNKYRIKTKRAIRHWKTINSYSAADLFIVQMRFLFVFWVTIDEYWDKEYADSHLKALQNL